MYRVSILLILVGLVFACKSDKRSDLDILFDQVMTEHDEAMALMQDIHSQRKILKEKIKDTSDTGDSIKISTFQKDLNDADEAMMEWMAKFKDPDRTDKDAAKAILDQQLKSIAEVHIQMKKAITDTKNYIN